MMTGIQRTSSLNCVWMNNLFGLSKNSSYPYKPPKLKCISKTVHPNISESGTVCLSVIREDWSPVYTLQTILQSLLTLFYYPNLDDPLNQEAANAYQKGLSYFKSKFFDKNRVLN